MLENLAHDNPTREWQCVVTLTAAVYALLNDLCPLLPKRTLGTVSHHKIVCDDERWAACLCLVSDMSTVLKETDAGAKGKQIEVTGC